MSGSLPTAVANLKYWYDFSSGQQYTDSGSAVASGDGQLIQQWNDLSGLGNHAIQTGSSGIRPTVSNISSSIRCVGGQYFVLPDIFSGSTEGELFWLVKIPSQNTQKGFVYFNSSDFNTHYTWDDGIIYDGTLTTVRKQVGNPGDLTTFRVYNVRSTNGEWIATLDGITIFSSSVNTFQHDIVAPRIGVSRDTYVGDFFLRQAVAYNRILTSTERSNVISGILTGSALADASALLRTGSARDTQEDLEVWFQSKTPSGLVTQEDLEVWFQSKTPSGLVTQEYIEVWMTNTPLPFPYFFVQVIG